MQSVRGVIEAAISPSSGNGAGRGVEGPGPRRWVSSAWLEEWANAEDSPREVDNRTLLCAHGTMDPFKVGGASDLL